MTFFVFLPLFFLLLLRFFEDRTFGVIIKLLFGTSSPWCSPGRRNPTSSHRVQIRWKRISFFTHSVGTFATFFIRCCWQASAARDFVASHLDNSSWITVNTSRFLLTRESIVIFSRTCTVSDTLYNDRASLSIPLRLQAGWSFSWNIYWQFGLLPSSSYLFCSSLTCGMALKSTALSFDGKQKVCTWCPVAVFRRRIQHRKVVATILIKVPISSTAQVVFVVSWLSVELVLVLSKASSSCTFYIPACSNETSSFSWCPDFFAGIKKQKPVTLGASFLLSLSVQDRWRGDTSWNVLPRHSWKIPPTCYGSCVHNTEHSVPRQQIYIIPGHIPVWKNSYFCHTATSLYCFRYNPCA